MKRVNHAGKYYGKLYVLKRNGTDKQGNVLWSCLCECGKIKNVRATLFNRKKDPQRSCGECHRTVHSGCDTPTYKSWEKMHSRCSNRNEKAYPNYGGRGIKVCYRWKYFELFLEDMGERPEGTSIDRIDNNGDYCPENCRWATRKQQNRNTRANTLLTVKGETKTQAEWCEVYGMATQTLSNRLKSGWSDERAVTTPVDKRYARK